ncbi:alkaline phosphatase PafA [Winogradskyella sp.]|uniref:alkaline phosphatase PafA n=1 Tax=Winogradskyella sp. TaxID=1883156 RepID=UPI002607309E|nr:alkaline phosphatase PafA [Winogradskyella sp.]
MQIKVVIVLLLFTFSSASSKGQEINKPKLVVGIVVDQMKAEYLYRFQDNYTEDGFKRLMREGFNVKNTHYNYIPTATGPGHTSIYTGTTPTNHGIVSNNWYKKALGRTIYCVEDTTAFLVGNLGVDKTSIYNDYQRSPKNIQTSTITDELKLFSNGCSKVTGLSIKDRGAICPAGHLADAAYWYNAFNGNFVTSTYYRNTLPKWLKDFNTSKKADSLLNLTWNPLLPMVKYTHSEKDDAVFEKIFKGRKKAVFPYNLKKLRKQNGDFALLTGTPFGNTLLTQMAEATVLGEHIGQGDQTDFLTISYSSTDYVGHHFGIRSKELEDIYVRLDRELSQLLTFLDDTIGKENYLLFLTADHAASDNPVFLNEKRLPGKFFDSRKLKEDLNVHLSKKFGNADYVAFIDKTQVYINDTKTSKEMILKEALNFLVTIEGIKDAFAPALKNQPLDNSTIGLFIKNSYNPKESGDILYQTCSGWMERRNFGTTHGTSYTSDTHVPLLWYGWNIPKGESSVMKHTITQIAPTLSMLLDIPLPNASNNNPILELFK